MIKLADYVINFFGDRGIDKAFIVYGAANGDLIDAFTRTREKIQYVSCMHEQGAGFALEGFAKVRDLPGLAIATSGPGGQNFVTSIANCFYDSVPGIFITGQVKQAFQRPDERVRQIGFQETDIVSITKPITKYSKMITDPNTIRYELEYAYYLATSGRPGPVLIDMPIDIQQKMIDPENQVSFIPSDDLTDVSIECKKQVKTFLEDFSNSKRPVILVGGGVRNARAINDLKELGLALNVPVFPTWNALDIVSSDYENYCGRIGTYGGAGRNFGIQNSDLLLSIGSRISGRITGGNVSSFAREAKKYMVDIDKATLKTEWQQVPFDENIYCDAKIFINYLKKQLNEKKNINKSNQIEQNEWLEKCKAWRREYDPVKPEFFKNTSPVHPYAFVRLLSEKMKENDVLVGDCGGNIVITNHAFETKKGQRYFTNNGNSPMGFSFAAAMGAFYGDQSRNVVCIIGDGGMNMNIQELQTIKEYNIKTKTIILNNHIYGITKAYQKTNFEGRMEACGPVGYNPPDFIEITKAYKIKTFSISEHSQISSILDEFLNFDGPCVLDVDCHEHHTYEPRIFGWKTPIEDMYPYLPREEFIKNMFIKPQDDWENPPLPDSDKNNKIETAE